MYWPTAAPKVISATDPVDTKVVKTVRPSRRGNFFASITNDTLAVWDVRVRHTLGSHKSCNGADKGSRRWYKRLWSGRKRVSSGGERTRMWSGHMMAEG